MRVGVLVIVGVGVRVRVFLGVKVGVAGTGVSVGVAVGGGIVGVAVGGGIVGVGVGSWQAEPTPGIQPMLGLLPVLSAPFQMIWFMPRAVMGS